MAGIRSGGIKYALGIQSAIGTRAIDEGLTLLEHTTPIPITDSLKGAITTHPDYGQAAEYHIPGTVYYAASAKIPFSPAWACRLLDLYYENTSAGGSPNYDRQYNPENIPAEPSKWLSLWKYTAKTGNDHNTVGVGGVIRRITIEGIENEAMTLTADIVFASREDDVSTGTPSDWDINESVGDYTPIRSSENTFLIVASARSVVSWRITLSHNFRPHFYASQNPDRISRLGGQIDGQFVLRDTDGILETYEDSFLSSTSTLFTAMSGSKCTVLLSTPKIHAPEIREEKGTRYGYYDFTGLSSQAGGTPPLRITLRPQIAGL